MKKSNSIYLVLGMFVLIYIVHVSGYISAYYYQKHDGYTGGSFSLTMLKGDQGLTLDVVTYMTQIRDSRDNGFTLFQRDPFIKENSGKGFPNGNLIYAAASFFYLFTSDPVMIYFISVFFSLLIATFLIYRIVILLAGPASNIKMIFIVSICAIYLTAFDSLLSLNNLFINLKGGAGLIRNLGYIGRFPHIEFSLVFLVFWFYCWTRCLINPSLKNSILLGFSLAVLQYCYFYFWTGACLFTTMHLFFSSIRDRSLLKKGVWIFGSYFLLTLPFWIKFWHFNHTDFAMEFAERCRPVHAHKPQVISMIMFFSGTVFCFDLLFCYSKKKIISIDLLKDVVRQSSFQLYLFFSVYILLNIQVLTGFNIQSYHWETTFFYPVFILLCIPYFSRASIFFNTHFSDKFKLRKFIPHIIVFFLLATSVFNNIRFGKLWAPSLYMTESEKELMDKIKRDIPANSVLMSNSFSLMGAISANTDMYTYVPYSFISNCTDEELTERLVNGFKAIGYSDQQIKDEMKKGEKWIAFLSDITSGKVRNSIKRPEPISDNFNSLVYIFSGTSYSYESKNYTYSKELEKKIDSVSNLLPKKSQKLDYIIIYKSILPPDYKRPTGIELVFGNKDFELYKMNDDIFHFSDWTKDRKK